MNLKLLILLTCVFLNVVLFSQSQPKAFEDWKTTTGTQNFFYKNITKTDGLGNVYVAGATVNGAGNTDILLAKYNSAGVQLWIRQYAGSANGTDFASDLTVTNNIAFLTGAVTNNTTTMLPDIITMAYKFDGTLMWATTYNGVANSLDVGKSIVRDATNGNIYVTGTSYNASYNADVAIIKYNSAGVQQWSNTYNHSANLDDAGIKVALKGTTGITVSAALTIGTNQYKYGAFLCSQATGSITSSSISSFITTSSITAVSDFITDASGNTILVGSMYVAGQGDNIYVQKLSSSLVSAWTYTYNNPSNLDDVAKAVQIDASGNVYITGYSAHATEGRNIVTIKLNSSGTQQWLQTINNNGNDEASDMAIDASSNIYIAGYIQSDINQADYYTAKYNSAGTKLWEVQTDGLHLNDQITNIALDSLNNVIVTGQSEITTGNFEFLTTRYVQRDVIAFTDLNNEALNPKCLFIPNKGQLLNTELSSNTDVLFYNLSNYPSSYMARNRLSFLQFHRDTLASTTDSIERIDMVFNKCKTNYKIYKEDQGTDYNYNYFVGNIKVSDIHPNNKIIAPEIYTGIDLHYYSNANGIKAYFVVKPTADPRQISILLLGQQSATITTNNLKITGLLGTINLRKPNVYNINGSSNVPITGSGWAISGSTISINTGAYNTSQPLVIEFSHTNENAVANLSSAGPSDNVDWCTYVGDVANDGFKKMAVDKANNKYLGGTTDGNNYPITAGVFSGNNLGQTAIIVTKFNALNQMKHSTYYGGTSSLSGYAYHELNGIAVDSLQNVFIAGRTSTSNFPFPTIQPAGSYQSLTNLAGSSAAYYSGYVVKLNPIMQNNLWGTYITNSDITILSDIMVDKNQNVTVVGINFLSGSSLNFPTPPAGAYYNTQGKGLLFRFNNNGVAQYATRTANWIRSIATNNTNGDYFIASKLFQTDAGLKFKNPGGGAYYDNIVNGYDYYIARFNNQDSITWATAFGGNKNEEVLDIAVKDSMLIVVGTVDGINFPIKYAPNQYVDSIHSNYVSNDYDVGLVRFNSYTGKHIYSSYYGGQVLSIAGVSRDENPTACIIDNYGNYYIAGNTTSDIASGFSLLSSNGFYYNSTYHPNRSGFLLSYNSNNDRRLATYLGGRPYLPSWGSLGSDDTYMNDMGLTSAGDLFIAGSTNANRYFPIYDASAGVAYMDTVLNSPTGATAAGSDGFVASLKNVALVGVHNLDKNQVFGDVLVYPNPSAGIYNIEIEGLVANKAIRFMVYNTMGQMVYQEDSKTYTDVMAKQLNLSSLSQGIYFINILQSDKQITVKIIKQ